MESDTPRTDAKDWMWTPAWAHPGQPLVEEERVVDAAFARELERELAAAIKQRDEARELYCVEAAHRSVCLRSVIDARTIARVRGWEGLFTEGDNHAESR
jgi:hypothetical protein